MSITLKTILLSLVFCHPGHSQDAKMSLMSHQLEPQTDLALPIWALMTTCLSSKRAQLAVTGHFTSRIWSLVQQNNIDLQDLQPPK